MGESEAEEAILDGTLIRGSEGELWFVPTEDLEAFRVPDDVAAKARREMDERPDVFPPLPEGSASPELSVAVAIRGPLGRRSAAFPAPSPQDPTAVAALDDFYV
jgi:hypothetical protein